MRQIKTYFDGERIVIPDEVKGLPPCEVIIDFGNGDGARAESAAWTKLQEASFRDIWDNEEDAIYDTL